MNFHLRLAPGTQVVADGGGTGMVRDHGPEGDLLLYSVVFPDGTVDVFRREKLTILKRKQQSALGPPPDPAQLVARLIPKAVAYRCVIGSRAYGLATEHSDSDVRGVFVAPPELLWSLQGAPDHLDNPGTEDFYWELTRFCVLGLKANPNILECLHTPIVEHSNAIGDELRSIREAFLSRMVHQTYNGYVLSQFKKIEQDLRTTGVPKWKHVMHLLRLLLSGTHLVAEGHVMVEVGNERERLLAVRRGEVEWDEVERWRLDLHSRFDTAIVTSPLPDLPDHRRVEQFVLSVRQRQAASTDSRSI